MAFASSASTWHHASISPFSASGIWRRTPVISLAGMVASMLAGEHFADRHQPAADFSARILLGKELRRHQFNRQPIEPLFRPLAETLPGATREQFPLGSFAQPLMAALRNQPGHVVVIAAIQFQRADLADAVGMD